MYCDLHTHSNYSDGTFTPSEIIIEAEKIGLSAVALCDHNTIDGVYEFIKCAQGKKVKAIAGVEISTDYNGTELHILALGLNKEQLPIISDYLKINLINKKKSNIKLIESLVNAGYDIKLEDLTSLTVSGDFNRAHVAGELVKKGYAKSIKEVFDTILRDDGPHYIKTERLNVFDVIKFIKSIGAVAVHAHPFLDIDEKTFREFLPKAISCGLDGFETLYSTYTNEQINLSTQIAKEFNLKQSGGSDFHGGRKPNISLGVGEGNLKVPIEFLNNLLFK